MLDRAQASLYHWPETARVERPVPKGKFYAHGKVTSTVHERFVGEVQRITWAYKLAETTINLVGSVAVPEIQVFRIHAKHDDVSDVVLSAIDKAVKSVIIFEVHRGDGHAGRTRMVAAHKQLGPAAPKPSAYFTTGWLADDSERVPLPAAINLPSLYAALLAPLLPVAIHPGEDAAAVATRVERARKMEREVAALQKQIRNEPQFNRKVELHRALRTRQATLTDLTSPNHPRT